MMKIQKQTIALWLAAVLTLSLFGCAGKPAETTAPPETTAPVETTVPPTTVVPTTVPPETTLPPDYHLTSTGHVRLDQLLEGTAISASVEDEKIILSEDGLVLELAVGSQWVHRDGYVIAGMMSHPRIHDGVIYVHLNAFQNLFLGEWAEMSLFHGIPFFGDEILDALDQPDASVFNQKLLAEVLLPASMEIDIPHVDMGRAFDIKPLSILPEILSDDLEGRGFSNPGDYTYGEYTILTGEAKYWSGPSDDYFDEEERAFAAEKGITLTDLYDLYRYFYGAMMVQSDETLKQVLEEYYTTDLQFLEGYRRGRYD